MQQKGQGIHPEVPHRPQRPGQEPKEQPHAAGSAQEHVYPQLPLGPAEDEEKGRRAGGQAVEDVQRRGQPGEPQAQRPQQIVHQPCREAQQHGLGKNQQGGSRVHSHGRSPEESS